MYSIYPSDAIYLLLRINHTLPPPPAQVKVPGDETSKLGPMAPSMINSRKPQGKGNFFGGLGTEVSLPKASPPKKKMSLDLMEEEPPMMQLPSKKPKKKMLNINIEKVNENFTFGGEKGKKLTNKEDEEKEL